MVARCTMLIALLVGCATEPARRDPALRISALEHPLKRTDGRVYRLRWLRSFHPQISVRIQRLDSYALVSAVMIHLDGSILRRRHFATRASSFDQVDAYLAEATFWQGGPTASAGEVLDGSYWIMEGTADGRYAVATLHSSDVIPDARGMDPPLPTANVAFRQAALLLLEIAGMKPWCSGDIY